MFEEQRVVDITGLGPVSGTIDVPVIQVGAPGTGVVILPPGFTVSPPAVAPPATTMQPSPTSPIGAPSILDSLSGSVEIFGMQIPLWLIIGGIALAVFSGGRK